MTTLSTHDTKRSEDVRARLVLLSEDARRWEPGRRPAAVARRGKYTGPAGPDRATQYFVLQTLVGAWPISEDRLVAYLEKASPRGQAAHVVDRAGRGVTTRPCGVRGRRARRQGDHGRRRRSTSASSVEPGRVNALAQKLLQLTMPGVPDSYQGSRALGPVARRPRQPASGRLRRAGPARRRAGPESMRRLPAIEDSGAAKLHLVRSALRLRRSPPGAVRRRGRATSRSGQRRGAATTCWRSPAGRRPSRQGGDRGPRLVLGLRQAGGWKDTAVSCPPASGSTSFTGKRHGAREGRPSTSAYLLKLLRDFPVALLVAAEVGTSGTGAGD